MKKTSLFALMLFLMAALQVHAQQQMMPPLINVTGVGEVKLQPDEVLLNFGVEMRDKSLDVARKQTDAKAAAIISYLKKQGVEAKNIQTSYMSVQPIYTGGDYGKASPDFYMAQKTMAVVIKKLNKFDEILSGLYGVGVNRVDGISFRVADLEKHKAEARKRAVADAKQRANALTSELGAKVGRVYSINENTYGGGPRPMYKSAMVMDAEMSGASEPSIAGGEFVVTSNVTVSFIIE
ncbi:SIMPL domain-containing protein [Pontibacter vulgaris]|uniref:SIMPL domain-containing protein n=1 Tax=Pontibacter vulgaris TaxID=2905679 RepID=UPI001FA7AA47|nr:SIMPL domain-containing protein [Pontibacter vulgaris]